jgi:hypothetical protein
LYKPPPPKAFGDYLPSPPIVAEPILANGQKIAAPGRHVYSFDFFGGPLASGHRGVLRWGPKSFEARRISPLGPKIFFLTFEPLPLAETGGRILWLPNDDPPLPPIQSPGVLGLAQFSDSDSGWLAAVNDLDRLDNQDNQGRQGDQNDSDDLNGLASQAGQASPGDQDGLGEQVDQDGQANQDGQGERVDQGGQTSQGGQASQDKLDRPVRADERARRNPATLAGWEAFPAAYPLGVSFVWDGLATGETVAQAALALPAEESLWILADSEEILLLAAKYLKKAGRPVLALGPALFSPELAALELDRLLADKAAENAATVAQARAELDRLRAEEKSAKDMAQKWLSLRALEKDLARLRQEVESREVIWAFLSGELASAQDFWAENSGSRSFWSFFRRKFSKNQSLAQSHLEAAEGEMAKARREKSALLAEARDIQGRLETVSRIVKNYPPLQEIQERLKNLEAETARQALKTGELASSFSRAGAAQGLWAERPAVVAFPGWAEPEHLAASGPIDNLVVANPSGQAESERAALARLARWPTKRLLAIGDFTAWSWAGGPFDLKARPFSSFLAPARASKAAAPAVATVQPGGESLAAQNPRQFPWLKEFGLAAPVNAFSWPGPWGPVWRAVGEVGPFNPVSALAAAHLALAAHQLAGPGERVYVLAPSPAQGAFLRALFQDLAPKAQNLAAGEPADLADWPKAALVVLDTALGQEHPWAWPAHGRTALMTALNLAQGAVALVGDEKIIAGLPPNSPLARLWREAAPSRPVFRWPPATSVTMWEALNRAQREAFFCLPPFEPDWWAPLSIHFQAALNRQVKITILAQSPPPERRKYCDSVIRDLKLFGAQVVVAEGFPDLAGLVDQKYLAFGLPGGVAAQREWNLLWTLESPKAGPILAQAAQAPLIAEKLGPRGFRNCPQCGWPYVLINQARAQDFNHRQPLRLGCLNPSCPNRQKPRRLDERWPFLAPPVCPKDGETPYVRAAKGRGEVWACPLHDRDCPRLKVIPGDVNPG